MTEVEIPGDDARALAYMEEGTGVNGWKVVAREDEGDSRWASNTLLVIQRADTSGPCYGAVYQTGLTEMQEQRPFEDETTVKFRIVTGREVRSVSWTFEK